MEKLPSECEIGAARGGGAHLEVILLCVCNAQWEWYMSEIKPWVLYGTQLQVALLPIDGGFLNNQNTINQMAGDQFTIKLHQLRTFKTKNDSIKQVFQSGSDFLRYMNGGMLTWS